jgi:hypothetical protein
MGGDFIFIYTFQSDAVKVKRKDVRVPAMKAWRE